MRHRLIRAVRDHTGYETDERAEAAVDAAIFGLIRMLPPEDAEPLARAVERPGYAEAASTRRAPAAEALALVARRLDVSSMRALEILRTVVAALPRAVDESLAKRLEKHLPEDFGTLFEGPGFVQGERPSAGPAKGPEVRPRDAARAHTHSVVNARNPHEKTKISSGQGSVDRKGGTIAESSPTSDAPIGEARPGDRG